MQVKPEIIIIQVYAGNDGVPVRRLISQMRDLLRTLVDLDVKMSEDQRKTTRWVIAKASYNSPLTLQIEARPIRGRTVNPDVPRAYVAGMRSLTKSAAEPAYFTPRMMATTKRLVETATKGGGKIAISDSQGQQVKPGKRMVKNIEHVLRGMSYREYTTIEGELDVINVHRRREFHVFDPLTDRPTICRFDKEQSEKARGALGRRVAVTGWLTFNKQDEPVWMDVEDIVPFDDSRELPLFLEGEQVDITGGVDSVLYIRMYRDAD
jgi:hypothetical protein